MEHLERSNESPMSHNQNNRKTPLHAQKESMNGGHFF